MDFKTKNIKIGDSEGCSYAPNGMHHIFVLNNEDHSHNTEIEQIQIISNFGERLFRDAYFAKRIEVWSFGEFSYIKTLNVE